MSTTIRRFRVPEGRAVVLPVGLQPGPGVTNMRHDAEKVFELDADRCAKHERFLNGRVRAGDLVELDPAGELPVAAAVEVPAPPSTSRRPDPKPALELTPKE